MLPRMRNTLYAENVCIAPMSGRRHFVKDSEEAASSLPVRSFLTRKATARNIIRERKNAKKTKSVSL